MASCTSFSLCDRAATLPTGCRCWWCSPGPDSCRWGEDRCAGRPGCSREQDRGEGCCVAAWRPLHAAPLEAHRIDMIVVVFLVLLLPPDTS